MNGTINVNVNVTVDRQFTEVLAVLASALGYPMTVGNEISKEAAEKRDEGEKITLEELRKLAFEVSERRGKDFVRKALEGFTLEDGSPVPRLSMLREADYAAFREKLGGES